MPGPTDVPRSSRGALRGLRYRRSNRGEPKVMHAGRWKPHVEACAGSTLHPAGEHALRGFTRPSFPRILCERVHPAIRSIARKRAPTTLPQIPARIVGARLRAMPLLLWVRTCSNDVAAACCRRSCPRGCSRTANRLRQITPDRMSGARRNPPRRSNFTCTESDLPPYPAGCRDHASPATPSRPHCAAARSPPARRCTRQPRRPPPEAGSRQPRSAGCHR